MRVLEWIDTMLMIVRPALVGVGVREGVALCEGDGVGDAVGDAEDVGELVADGVSAGFIILFFLIL